VTRTIVESVIVALLALVALWAFVEYLQPAFSGEAAAELLRCN
jgi:Tfp pilus assembly protein PilE